MRSLDELSVLFRSASKQRTWWYELGLFVAWHMAAFNSQAKAGKLKDFSHYRTKLTGATAPSSTQSWKDRKAERQRQMDQLKRHQQIRKAPVKRKT